MARILLSVLLTGLTGSFTACLGAPDRYEVGGEYGWGDFTRSGVPTLWESEEMVAKVSVSGPIGWGGTPVPREMREAKAEMLEEIRRLEDDAERGERSLAGTDRESVPWEEIMAGLMVLAGGGAIGHEQYRNHQMRKKAAKEA